MRWILQLAMLATMAWASPAAAGPTLPLMPGYKRTAFTVEDGAPSAATAIAQTPDGFLWIGTSQGLWRFDGVRFERVATLEKVGGSGVRSLLVTRGGDLWIGYGFGGVALARGGRILSIDAADAPKGWVYSLAEAPDGAIWAVSGGAMYRYAAGRWTKRSYSQFGRAQRALVRRDGSVWVCIRDATRSRLLRLDARSFSPTVIAELGNGACAIAEAPDGAIVVADQTRIRVGAGMSDALIPRATLPAPMSEAVITVGRNGDAWIAGFSRRIFRVALHGIGRAGVGETATFESPGGAAGYATGAFEDREGNWWVGTDRGIDRFHPVDVVHNSATDPRLLALVPIEENPYQLLVDGQRTVFVRVDRRLFRIAPDGSAMPLAMAGLSAQDVECAARDAGVWVRTMRDTVRLVGGERARSVRLPAGFGADSRCFEDRDGRLWVGIAPSGLIRYDSQDRNPQAVSFDDRPGTIPYMIAQGGSGVVTYVGYGYTAAFGGRAFRMILGYQPNPFTFIGTILQRPEGLLIGGESGLGMLRDGRIRMMPAGEKGVFGDVSGLVQNAAGETWLLSQAGLVRLSSAALSARLKEGSGALPLRIFDQDDGVLARSSIQGFTDLVEAADGRLWFANQTGIYSIDPRRLTRNSLPPEVVVRAVSADGRPIAPAPQLRLAAGTRGLQIDFTAASLGVPKRVSFRYRLAGVDADWIDPGARRQAIYTGLGPGTYRFQVIASNDDHVWNRTGFIMEIVIPPTFVESRWFLLLCVVAALTVGWLLYSLRIRHLRHRFNALLRERLDERERIARDLHDTLLQGFQGLMLRFQVVANRLLPDDPLRSSVDQALDRAEAVLVESRDKVSDLRNEANGPPLEERIRHILEALTQDGGTRTALTVEGTPRPVSRRAAEEAAAIAEEALRNAHRHAAAAHVQVVVTYGHDALTVVVRDDGRGFDQEEAAHKRQQGHFGLIGMDERALHAGGTLSVSARRGRGTEIMLTVPALAAYGPQRARKNPFW
ncbi:sensor histidine kinase [Sphingomonas sp. LM7]|uniref:sensor histidine kinase n=1 Tax=Sphingomonas sp. LM7 TaxID=1938607 RepID=UPI000983DF59|nr:sensor histidine kinase [Sphingomonas sp. LM7]AQR73346.1 hypothetical protein BXU08_06520 [Sphingomonas sp. LM7]